MRAGARMGTQIEDLWSLPEHGITAYGKRGRERKVKGRKEPIQMASNQHSFRVPPFTVLQLSQTVSNSISLCAMRRSIAGNVRVCKHNTLPFTSFMHVPRKDAKGRANNLVRSRSDESFLFKAIRKATTPLARYMYNSILDDTYWWNLLKIIDHCRSSLYFPDISKLFICSFPHDVWKRNRKDQDCLAEECTTENSLSACQP